MCSWNTHRDVVGRRRKGLWFLIGLPIFLLLLGLGSLIFMLLWNALIPGIFGLKLIGYWQALGLLVLARILFGGFKRPRPFYGWPRHPRDWRRWHEEEHGPSEPEGKQG